MKASPLTTLLTAVALTGVGAFLAGRYTMPDGRSTNDSLPTKATHSAGTSSTLAGHDAAGAATRVAHSAAGAKKAETAAIARMRAVLNQGDPLSRTRAWLAFLDKLSAAEFESVTTAFRENGVDSSRMGEYAMLLTAWAKLDPLAALDFAKTNTGSPFARQTILAAWAATDPESAIHWAEQNHEGDGANPWMVGIIRGLANTDPERAASLMQAMPRSQERGEALDALLPTILDRGAAATHDWIAAIPDETLRNGAMSRVAERLAQSDPAGTASWLAANPGEATNRSIDDVMSVWIQKDKTAAVDYYQSLPAGDTRTNALRGLINSLATSDPRAAADFLERNSAYTSDPVYQQFVWHSFGEAPDLAANYIGRIADPTQRDATYRRMLDAWLRRDLPAASQWINNAAPQLSPDVQQHLNRSIQRLNQQQQ